MWSGAGCIGRVVHLVLGQVQPIARSQVACKGVGFCAVSACRG